MPSFYQSSLFFFFLFYNKLYFCFTVFFLFFCVPSFRFFVYRESLVFLFSLCFFLSFLQSFSSRIFAVHFHSVSFLCTPYCLLISFFRFRPSDLRGDWPDWLWLRKEIRCPNIWTVDRGTCPFSTLEIRSTDHSLQRLAPFPRRQIDRDIAMSGGPGPPPPLSHSVAHGFASARLRNSSSSSRSIDSAIRLRPIAICFLVLRGRVLRNC